MSDSTPNNTAEALLQYSGQCCVAETWSKMERRGITLSLLMVFVTVVTSQDAMLPVFTSVAVSTSEYSEGAVITLEYVAPAEPFVLWFINGVPLNAEGGKDYVVINNFKDTKHGTAILISSSDKKSIFGICLHNFEAENCMFLAPLPSSDVVREELAFPWPDMTPGPDVKYEQGQKVVINAPVLDTPHMYFYSAIFFSQDPDDNQGDLMTAMTQGMDGGQEGDPVTVGPSSQGGWDIVVRTDLKNYQGVLQMNTTFVPQAVTRPSPEVCRPDKDGDCQSDGHDGMYQTQDSNLVLACFLIEPFTISLQESEHPFPHGFLAPIPNPVSWRGIEHLDCMVACAFLTDGHDQVHITIVRTTSADGKELPVQPEGEVAVTRMLGPYLGYGAIYIPDFVAERDAGTYKCSYRTSVASKDLSVVVN